MTMTIDRAIEILNPEHREHYDGLDEVNEACRMGMEALKQTKWIPCSERLPDTETEVLALCRRGGVSFNIIDCAVTHWMPLPEPPEEG